jgi:ASC-1-like (ASCH) protein
MHSMKFKEPHFTNVLIGKKIYELRINDEKRQKMNIGDNIIINNNDNLNKKYQIVITDKHFYNNFESAIRDSGIKKILPNVKSIKKGIELYEKFPGYIEGAKKYGIVRFSVVINNNIRTHNLTIQNPKICPTFDFIMSGIKTVEGRKNSPKYQEYKSGDILIFECGDNTLKTVIKDIKKYTDVNEYLQKETLKKTLPCVKTIKEGIKIYNLWNKTSEINKLRKKYGYGFLGIHIKKIM